MLLYPHPTVEAQMILYVPAFKFHFSSSVLNSTFGGRGYDSAINSRIGYWEMFRFASTNRTPLEFLGIPSIIKYNARASYHLCDLIALYGAASGVGNWKFWHFFEYENWSRFLNFLFAACHWQERQLVFVTPEILPSKTKLSVPYG